MAILPTGWSDTTQYTTPPAQQALEAILSADIGAELDSVELDGRVHRFKVRGDKARQKSGWYKFYGDRLPAGAFGSWRGDICIKWHARGEQLLTDADREEIEATQARILYEREQEAKRQHEAAAQSAAHIWQTTADAAADHPYLTRKGVKSHGLHQTADGRLVMPIYVGDRLTSLQYIDGDGGKCFHAGGEVAAGYYMIPATQRESRTLYICEGYATGASIAEATGAAVVVALNAGNLLKVAPWIRTQLPDGDLVIVADNDANGVGQKKAHEAAALSGARVIVPPEEGDATDYAQRGRDLAALLTQRRPWLIKGRDFYKKPDPIKWLIKGWVQANAMMMCFGESGAGKTFFVLDLALTIASGMTDWHGHRGKPGPVGYLAGEGHYGLKARIAAWVHERGRVVDDIYVSESACDLNTDEGYNKGVREINDYEARPVLIVVDTLNRFLLGDENKADDARSLIDACGKLMQQYRCSVLIVHHTGVSPDARTRARGSSAFKGAMDVELLVEAVAGGAIKVTQTKSKDAEVPKPLCFDKVQVTVPGWYDDDGDPVTSVVLVPAVAVKAEGETKRGKAAQRGMDAYEQAARTKGHLVGDMFGGVDLEDWRDAFEALGEAGETADSMRGLFSRAKRQLLDSGELVAKNMRFYPGGDLAELRERWYINDLQKVNKG